MLSTQPVGLVMKVFCVTCASMGTTVTQCESVFRAPRAALVPFLPASAQFACSWACLCTCRMSALQPQKQHRRVQTALRVGQLSCDVLAERVYDP